jgi:hypothetical protein
MRPFFKYDVMMRAKSLKVYKYTLDAESVLEAQRMAETLHPEKRILRITPSFESG